MKKSSLILWLILVSFVANAQTKYYFFQGERIPLVINKDYINVIMAEAVGRTLNATHLFQEFNLELDQEHSAEGLVRLRLGSAQRMSEYSNTVESLRQSPHIRYVFPFFERGEGVEPIGTSNYFYIQLRSVEDVVLLERVAGRKNVQIIRQVPYMPLWYILSVKGSVFNNSIEATNYFFETGLFQEVDPAFMFNFQTSCTNDPMFGQLWGLRNTTNAGIDINICNAWTITRGAGVNVAVIDQGIDPNHNDLRGNFHSLSFDAQTGQSPSAFVSSQNHGTHVAGTIGAVRNNGLQVVGVAPEARIMRVSHSLSTARPNASAELASGISWAWYEASADIINNSWGDWGGQHFNLLHSAVLESAIESALRYGRNGRGTIVVFASGNTGLSNRVDYPGSSHDDILVVGSINANGRRSSFSNHGNRLNVVAPGNNILSTNNNNDTITMSGTSMAAPHVAGVAALILSVRPDLTQEQVRHVIELTARRLSNYTFNFYRNRPNGTWNNQVGHGLVDAHTAICMALSMGFNTSLSASYSLICDQSSFSIADLPLGAVVYWSSENIDLSERTGASTTASRRPGVSGSASITAHVSFPECPSRTLHRELYVGAPSPNSISSKYDGEQMYGWGWFSEILRYNNAALTSFGNPHGIFDIEWQQVPQEPPFEVLMGDFSTPMPGYVFGAHRNLEIAHPTTFRDQQVARILVRMQNQCGWSSWRTLMYVVTPPSICAICLSPGCYGKCSAVIDPCPCDCRPWSPCPHLCLEFTFSPNPVSANELRIDFRRLPTALGRTEVYVVRLLDAMGRVQGEAQFSHTNNNTFCSHDNTLYSRHRGQIEPVIFDASQLPDGTYYLHIKHNGEIQKHQIIVQRN